MILHAEFDHSPDDSGVVTICGRAGDSDNNFVSCLRCIGILRSRGMLHLITLDIIAVLEAEYIPQRRIETVKVRPGLL